MANTVTSEVPSPVPMPVTTGRSEQVAIRLPHEHVERCRAVREALTRPGIAPPSMSEVMRAIFGKGLEAWEAELNIKVTAPKKSGKGR